MQSTKTQTNGKVKPDAAPPMARAARRRAKPAPGARLAAAFEAVEHFPVLVESRARVMHAATAETARIGELVEAVESDVGLAIAVLRFANRSGSVAGVGRSIPEASTSSSPPACWRSPAPPPSSTSSSRTAAARCGRSASASTPSPPSTPPTRSAARSAGTDRDELAVASLLHDVGRLVICNLHPGDRGHFDAVAKTPEQRLREERDRLGIDHALVGGVLARRWNVPQRIAVAIERHHAEDAEGLAAMVATADMVAHYCQGEAVAPERLRAAAKRCGLDPEACASSSTSFPTRAATSPRVTEPCPLSARELDVLRHLSEGMVYKQIAGEMQLSVSTIRTHLHNVYGKIGAVDRAQAVLTARDRGWI